MANQMSNFDNFDIHQMSPKLAQRWHFVGNFYCKKIFALGSIDYAKNAKRHLFFGHPISIATTTMTATTKNVLGKTVDHVFFF